MRRCVFCDEGIDEGSPPEHVLPQWIRRFRPKHGRFIEARGLVVRGQAPRPIPTQPVERSKVPTVRSYLVCRECNGHWMSDLETRASPLLTPMIIGQARSLTVEEQAFIAVWAIKTDMTWQTAETSFRATPLHDYLHLRTHRMPPPHARVRLGRYLGTAFLAFADHNLAHLGPDGGRVELDSDPEGHWAILRIGQLVFEIFGSRQGGLPTIHKPELDACISRLSYRIVRKLAARLPASHRHVAADWKEDLDGLAGRPLAQLEYAIARWSEWPAIVHGAGNPALNHPATPRSWSLPASLAAIRRRETVRGWRWWTGVMVCAAVSMRLAFMAAGSLLPPTVPPLLYQMPIALAIGLLVGASTGILRVILDYKLNGPSHPA